MRRCLWNFSLIFVALLSLGGEAAWADIEKDLAGGRFRQALSELDRLLSKDRHNPEYLFQRALALSGLGQDAEAISQYRALIKQYPDLPEPYNNLAVIYNRQGKVAEAQALLGQAMQAHAGYKQVYQNLQVLNTARARDAYAKALQINSKSSATQLQRAERLVLQQAAIRSVRPAPPVTRVTPQEVKPALRYQASEQQADMETVARSDSVKQKADDFREARNRLQQWARAWSAKDVERYLQFYSEGYAPPGQTRGSWEQQRHRRINKPKWIRIRLHNMQLHAGRDDELVIRLEQEYSADNYSDVTRKEFTLRKHDGNWRIIKERGLGYLQQ